MRRTTTTPTTDRELFDLCLKWAGEHPGKISKATIRLAPVPAARPRVAKFGTYYPKSYTQWMKAALEAVEFQAMKEPDAPVAVLVEHVCPPMKTVSRRFPKGDVDNYAKATLDLMTKMGAFWTDDDQVLTLVTSKRFVAPGEEPHTNVHVISLEN